MVPNRLRRLGALALLLVVPTLLVTGRAANAADTLSPSSTLFEYDGGPYTNVNVSGLVGDACDVPSGCDEHALTVDVPPAYYAGLRAQGKVGVVQIAVSWPDNQNDFDLALQNSAGDPIATSGFGNSDFERINYVELPSGTYTISNAIFRALNVSIHVKVSLQAVSAQPSSAIAATNGLAFSNGTVATHERSSGEPNLEIGPDGTHFADQPLGAGTNSLFLKSPDKGLTWRALGPLHPNQNPLTGNAAGGGDSGIAIGSDGRVCISELNTLVSLGVSCSSDGGKTFGPTSQVADALTPLVDRQWQTATPDGEQYIAAQFGILTVGPSSPGVRLFRDLGTGQFVEAFEVDTGAAMKSYTLAVDPSDTDDDGGTLVQGYLRSNQGADRLDNPHQLMIWRSTDGGTTVKRHILANLPTTPGNNFAFVASDTVGNIYVAWSVQGSWDVAYSVISKADLDAADDQDQTDAPLPGWSEPVIVNTGEARTAIQPTIKVGDPGRVFLGFYAAPQIANPDNLVGYWDAFMATSTDGACQLDDSCGSSGKPVFHQAKITEHPAQYNGICLGGTGCGGDPYYGDRSMLEYLDVEFDPDTGGATVITTDSSRQNGGTTATTFKQIGGPSAYAGKPAVSGTTRVGSSITDEEGDANFPYETSPADPSVPAPGGDLTTVELSYPDANTLRVVMHVSDLSQLDEAAQTGLGEELLIATRFSTDKDVFWAGVRHVLNGDQTLEAGRLEESILISQYAKTIDITGEVNVDANTITLDVPLAELTSIPRVPDGETAEPVQGIAAGQTLYAVTAFAHVTKGTAAAGSETAHNLLDITPAFRFQGAAVVPPTTAPSGSPTADPTTRPRPGGPGTTPSTGSSATLAVLAAASAVIGVSVRRRLRGSHAH
jgi:hypothetical protein